MFVKSTSSPAELREIATGLGIVWVGKSNEDLANEINEAMQAKMSGATVTNLTGEEFLGMEPGETKEAFPKAEEQAEEVTETEEVVEETQEEVTPEVEETIASETTEEVMEEEKPEPQLQIVDKEEKPAAETTEQKETPAPKTTGKWFEQEGAFPYKEGQKIQIIEMENKAHSFLNGRFAVINGPSTKKNAVKAQLINDKTNQLQKTNVTFNFTEFEVVGEKNEQEVM